VIDHFGINCTDYPRSQQFYDRVLGVLGYSRQADFGEAIGYGRDGEPVFWIAEGAGMGPNRETHSPSPPPITMRCGRSMTPRSSWAPSRRTPRGCGRKTTLASSAPSSVTRTATMSKRSATRRVATMSDDAVRELLRDAFTRLIEHVDELTAGLTEEQANYRPSPDANSIAWLIWHSARVQDIQLAPIAGIEQVWTHDGWVDRFGLDLPRNDSGYGHGPDEVAKVHASAELLAGYYHALHKVTLEFVARVTAEDLARIVDRNWDPPVTASARIVSIIDDCAQHLGQAAYVLGIAP